MAGRWLIAVAAVALMAAPAKAADLPVKAPLLPPVAPYSWTGLYVGGNIGGSFGYAGNNWNIFAAGANAAATRNVCRPGGSALCATGSDSDRLNGLIGGAQIGYNWQIADYLVGIETDFDGTGQKGGGALDLAFPLVRPPGGTVAAAYSESLAWVGTVRARFGYVLANQWLFYGTGGLAYGRVNSSGSATSVGFTGIPVVTALGAQPCANVTGIVGTCPVAAWSDGTTKVGWVLGAGVAGVIVGNWTWRVEYLHIDLGNVGLSFATSPGCFGTTVGCGPVAAGTGSISSHVTDDIFRIGIDYRFGLL